MTDIQKDVSLKMKLRENKAVGVNQSRKLIKSGLAESVCIAKDADSCIMSEFKTLCHQFGVPIQETGTMAQLGQRCGIDVKCAVYAQAKKR